MKDVGAGEGYAKVRAPAVVQYQKQSFVLLLLLWISMMVMWWQLLQGDGRGVLEVEAAREGGTQSKVCAPAVPVSRAGPCC